MSTATSLHMRSLVGYIIGMRESSSRKQQVETSSSGSITSALSDVIRQSCSVMLSGFDFR